MRPLGFEGLSFRLIGGCIMAFGSDALWALERRSDKSKETEIITTCAQLWPPFLLV